MNAIRRKRSLGISSVEYIIILMLVGLTGIAVFKTFGKTIAQKMNQSNTTMQNDVASQGGAAP